MGFSGSTAPTNPRLLGATHVPGPPVKRRTGTGSPAELCTARPAPACERRAAVKQGAYCFLVSLDWGEDAHSLAPEGFPALLLLIPASPGMAQLHDHQRFADNGGQVQARSAAHTITPVSAEKLDCGCVQDLADK